MGAPIKYNTQEFYNSVYFVTLTNGVAITANELLNMLSYAVLTYY